MVIFHSYGTVYQMVFHIFHTAMKSWNGRGTCLQNSCQLHMIFREQAKCRKGQLQQKEGHHFYVYIFCCIIHFLYTCWPIKTGSILIFGQFLLMDKWPFIFSRRPRWSRACAKERCKAHGDDHGAVVRYWTGNLGGWDSLSKPIRSSIKHHQIPVFLGGLKSQNFMFTVWYLRLKD